MARPVGTTKDVIQDPTKLQKERWIREHKFYSKIVDDLERKYNSANGTMPVADVIQIANFLKASLTDGLRYLVAPAKAASPQVEESSLSDAEKFLAELSKGE